MKWCVNVVGCATSQIWYLSAIQMALVEFSNLSSETPSTRWDSSWMIWNLTSSGRSKLIHRFSRSDVDIYPYALLFYDLRTQNLNFTAPVPEQIWTMHFAVVNLWILIHESLLFILAWVQPIWILRVQQIQIVYLDYIKCCLYPAMPSEEVPIKTVKS